MAGEGYNAMAFCFTLYHRRDFLSCFISSDFVSYNHLCVLHGCMNFCSHHASTVSLHFILVLWHFVTGFGADRYTASIENRPS